MTADEAAGAGGSGVSWAAIILLLLALAVVVAAVVGPRTIRGRRRERRLEGGPEEAWLELRDTVVDLGMIWPPDRSPRQTRSVLVRYFGAPVDDFTAEVPRRGPDTNPDAVTAVDSIVHALERRRYARAETSHPGAWRAEVQTCAEALYGGAPRAARRRATWLPRSVFRRTRPVRTTGDEAEQVEVPAHGRVIDHVG